MNSTTQKNSLVAGGFKRRGTTNLFGMALAGLLLAGSQLATAQVMVVDRGLPTANLNILAGTDRSNVEWADYEPFGVPCWLTGDDFTLPAGPGTYYVKTIRVWTTSDTIGLSLWGGVVGDPIAQQSITYSVNTVTYVNGEGYQGYSGPFYQIYQIDFSVNIPLNGGQKYQFFLDGPPTQYDASGNVNAFLHCSNAALSVSPQQGADDHYLNLDTDGNVLSFQSLGNGWDKNSDANVQVFASKVSTSASKDQCKNGGWMNLVRANGTPFKNQGDAIQYVNTGK